MQNNDQKNLRPKKGWWWNAKPTPHTTKKLKDGTEKNYYVFSIPSYGFSRGEVDPDQWYRIEIYPIEDPTKKRKSSGTN